MDTKIKKLLDFLVDYQLKISDSIDPLILDDLKKSSREFVKLEDIVVKKYDQSTVNALDARVKFLDNFDKLIDSLVGYGWGDSLMLIDSIKTELESHKIDIEDKVSQMLGLFGYESEIYISEDLGSNLNIKILSHAFTLKNTELNKKTRTLIEKIKTQLLVSDGKYATKKGEFNYDTYSLRIIRKGDTLGSLLGHNSDIDDPEKLAKILKIRLVITDHLDDRIIYNDDTILKSESFPDFLGVNKRLIETNQTTIQFTGNDKKNKPSKTYRDIIGKDGPYYYVVKYPDFWALCAKYGENIPESVVSSFITPNKKIVSYGKLYNAEFLRITGIDPDKKTEQRTYEQKDLKQVGSIMQKISDLLDAEKTKVNFERFKKIIEKNLMSIIRDNLDIDLDPVEIAITLKYTFGNLINDIISYISDMWPDLDKIDKIEKNYSPSEYKRYMTPKILEILHKALSKVFNKSNNFYEILKSKEKIYVKDL